jgi:NitT/TauT family transport system substrate-binding protein
MKNLAKTLRSLGSAVLIAGVVSTTFVGCASSTVAPKNAPEVSTVRLTVFPSLNALGSRVADTEGFFTKNDLKVTLTNGTNAATAIPQMIGGSVDIVLMDMVTPIIARSKNVPLVMVAPAGVTKKPVDNRGFVNVIVRAGSPLKSMKDLTGHSVGIIQINSQPWMDTRAAVDAAGGDSKKIDFVEVPNLATALEQGQVDSIVVPDPISAIELADPANALLGSVATEDRVGAPEYAFVTTEKFATANPQTIARFQKAVIEANKLVNSDRDLGLKVAASYIDLPAEILAKATIPQMGTTALVSDDVAKSTKRMGTYELITKALAKKIDSEIIYPSK